MAENSKIQWTDHTQNFWVGCTRVGPGCDHCYAEAQNARFGSGTAPNWGTGAPRRRTAPANWAKPHQWQAKRSRAIEAGLRPPPVRVFASSLSDFFDNEVDPTWRADALEVIRQTPDLEWQLVTKRVSNVEKMLDRPLPPNVILIATIVYQDEAYRDLPRLARVRDRGLVRWIGVSYEPALGPVRWRLAEFGINWLIVGGESDQRGAPARAFEADWAVNALAEGETSGVPVFIKQLGSRCIMNREDAVQAVGLGAGWHALSPGSEYGVVEFRARAGGDIIEWPPHLRVRQFPAIMEIGPAPGTAGAPCQGEAA